MANDRNYIGNNCCLAVKFSLKEIGVLKNEIGKLRNWEIIKTPLISINF
jgi:hypothetical protein